VPKGSGLGVATQSPWLLSQHIALFDTRSCKKRPSALKEEHGHPLSHEIFNFLTVAAYARRDNPLGLEAVPQGRLPCCGQLQGSRGLASRTTGSYRQEESPSRIASKGRL